MTPLPSQSKAELDKLRQENERLQAELKRLKQQQIQQIQDSKFATTGNLAAGLAHEINNPICFIDGNLSHAQQYSALLLEIIEAYGDRLPVPDPALAAMLDEIDVDFIRKDFPRLMASMRAGSRRIRNVVTSLRTFANLDAAHIKTVDLHRNLDSALNLLNHRLLGGSNPGRDAPPINLIRHYRELPPVECYPGPLNQVFFNVLNNAIDAIERRFEQHRDSRSPSHETVLNDHANDPANDPAKNKALEGTLTLATAWNREQDWVEVTIQDNGDGIDEGDRPHIFDPFFSTKPIGHGIGLGLTEAHQVVVEHHNGHIDVETASGQGTTLMLKIPVVCYKSCPRSGNT